MRIILSLFILMFSAGCVSGQNEADLKKSQVICGAERTESYLSLIADKSVGVVANKTSRIDDVHLVDTLLSLGIDVKIILAPEHGFRGVAEAGVVVEDGKDQQTGIPIVSIYGNNRKPSRQVLDGLDLILFDIQDVGARFYTYISTLHYVLEACAEAGIPVIILDRPNPLGFVVDGPVLELEYRSFIGMHQIPVVHGMTFGEAAGMINGEKWLANGVHCELQVIKCDDWDHSSEYILPVKPSPNLPNQTAIYLYPTLCFFEGTVMSEGRGTPYPFQVYGHPDLDLSFYFTPQALEGGGSHDKFPGIKCYGEDFRKTGEQMMLENRQILLDILLGAYRQYGEDSSFFSRPDFFDKLAGTDRFRKQILEGKTAKEIRQSWQDELSSFKEIRKKYLLYPDFE